MMSEINGVEDSSDNVNEISYHTRNSYSTLKLDRNQKFRLN